jgi:soluble lytic murein transglycosylase-like protein
MPSRLKVIILVLLSLCLVINLSVDVIARHIVKLPNETRIEYQSELVKMNLSRNKIFRLFKDDLKASYNKKYFANNPDIIINAQKIAYHCKDPILFYAIAKRESNFNSSSISSVGAITIFQIHPINEEKLKTKGIINEFNDLNDNIFAAIRASEIIFHDMKEMYSTKELDLLLYAYSGFMTKERKPMKRGKSYVTNIMTTYANLQYKLKGM